MDISQLLQSIVSNPAMMNQLSQQAGISQEQTQSAVQQIVPTLVGAAAKNAGTEQGASMLTSLLDRNGDGSIMDDVMGMMAGGGQNSGGAMDVLSGLLGNKQAVVQQAVAQQNGISPDASSSMFQMLAPLVMGFLGQQQQQQGGIAGLLSGLVGGQQQIQQQAPPQAQGLLGLLDMDGDGNSMDDIMGFLGKFMQK